ncbi:MAG: SUMF1/EgtB/PvdO family nonheme iron enzyme [Anaerolineae bacterium]|nr:SUMF1/EgtB/PvdO family nonheme iron enzyme [Anaerolineae bacterium]
MTEYFSDDSNDLTNNGTRVLRGGSWNYSLVLARAASRDNNSPDDRHYDLGFRVVCASPFSPH